jgi:hypothetical protein
MEFSYVASTNLPVDRVWDFLTDIQNWPNFSNSHLDLDWNGRPWASGSYLVGHLCDPHGVEIRHMIRTCDPPTQLRLLSQGLEFGFAVESIVRLEPVNDGTRIHLKAYAAGNAARSSHGAFVGSLTNLTQQMFTDFARLCGEEEPTFSTNERELLLSVAVF